MTVPQELTIQNLTTLLSIRTSLPEQDLRLVYAGKHLSSSPSSTLADNHIQRESTIHLALPLRGGAPKRLRCTHKDCKEVAQRIIGDCGFCDGHFCGKHRLLEDHKCTGLEDVSFSISSDPQPTDGRALPQWWLVGLDPELLADMMIAV
jgi:AN1-like Zinc finger/Ubiquitin family